MMNFVLGTVAGGIIAGIATIAAARHPEVQSRLGLVPEKPAPVAPAPVVRIPDPPCRAVAVQGTGVSTDEVLFSKRRFWSVAP